MLVRWELSEFLEQLTDFMRIAKLINPETKAILVLKRILAQ
jgi:hypothetical protein